ncbi:MAG TPA: hypothetical protein VMO78_02485 [Rhizomicrobium sp.]|nr:hypothetical protein [Rhizomicrobium sp.]
MNLDERLSQPLPEIADRHFSAQVMAEFARREIRRARIEAASWIALATAVVAIFAVTESGRQLATSVLSLGFFAQICVGLVILLFLFPPTVAVE